MKLSKGLVMYMDLLIYTLSCEWKMFHNTQYTDDAVKKILKRHKGQSINSFS